MRKSLLITSALGLMTVLPTFAMANAAAGSTAAVCGSGFFAQFDLKAMNAKLGVKNGAKTASKVDLSTFEAEAKTARALSDAAETALNAAAEVVSEANEGVPGSATDAQQAAQTAFNEADAKAEVLEKSVKLLKDLKDHDSGSAYNKIIDATTVDNTDRSVHNHALAGGVGATAGWWQNMGSFAVSISGSGDYHWGTFKVSDTKSGETVKAKDKKKLGFGFQGDLGLHYVVSPSTTLGVLVGFRGQQLNIGRTDKNASTTNNKDSKGDYTSKWMLNPVVSVQARTFFTDTVYGALRVGYIIPMSEKDYKKENTNIEQEAKIRFQGLNAAFSVGMMF